MTVYVIHAASDPRDISDALRFGEPANVFDPGDWPTMFPEGASMKVCQRLADFNPDRDYLLWYGGDPMALMAVGAWLYREGIDPQWLKASREQIGGRRTGRFTYTPVKVAFDWPADEDDEEEEQSGGPRYPRLDPLR